MWHAFLTSSNDLIPVVENFILYATHSCSLQNKMLASLRHKEEGNETFNTRGASSSSLANFE